MHHRTDPPPPPPERIGTLPLIPGHASTAAEVWVWQGRVPEVSHHARSWVVLRTDDWPMSAESARELAAALLRAADRVEAAAPDVGNQTGAQR